MCSGCRDSFNSVKPIEVYLMNFRILGNISLLLLVSSFSSLANADSNWIDVRSELEYSIDSIEGDVRISHGDIVKQINQMFPDKGSEIQLYCRSGGRAGIAMSALRDAGYTNVSNAGGIDQARRKRGLSE
ncbi:MAG: phage shock protein E [Neolewinella sp.]|jgi:phage shock protein E